MKAICLFIKKLVPLTLSAILLLALLLAPNLSPDARAASAEEIDVSVQVALERFKNEVRGANEFLANAKGILVIPNVIRVGFVIGGEYGEGALIIDGETVDYYSTTGGSLGLQIGAQSKNIVIIFMEDDALTEFRNSLGWRAGIDGSVVFIDYGAGTSVDSENVQHPIVGFVFGLKGLMANLSLEGAKFTKLIK